MFIAICDDDKQFCKIEKEVIKKMFEQHFQGEECIVDIFNDGGTLLEKCVLNNYDIVFLDLELKEENGFDVAEKIIIINNKAIIIFVTSHENLVYEAFRFRPLGYIVKDRFDKDFTRIIIKIIDALIKTRLVIDIVGEKIYVDKIISITTSGRKLRVKGFNIERLVNDSYGKYVKELSSSGYVECSKGVLINMKHIKHYNEEECYFLMYDNEKIPISRRRKKEVLKNYREYIIEK